MCLPSTDLPLVCRVLQIGKNCYDCLRAVDDVQIVANNHLVTSCVKPWLVVCALRRRRKMIEVITTESDQCAAANSTEKHKNDNRTATPAKRPREGRATEPFVVSKITCLLRTTSIELRTLNSEYISERIT